MVKFYGFSARMSVEVETREKDVQKRSCSRAELSSASSYSAADDASSSSTFGQPKVVAGAFGQTFWQQQLSGYAGAAAACPASTNSPRRPRAELSLNEPCNSLKPKDIQTQNSKLNPKYENKPMRIFWSCKVYF